MASKRNYKREYQQFQGTPQQIQNRSKRNQARAGMIKRKGKAAVEGKDVGHIQPLSKGGSNAPGNLRLEEPSVNRARKDKKKGT